MLRSRPHGFSPTVRRHRALQRKHAADRAVGQPRRRVFSEDSLWIRGRARVGFSRLEPREDGVGDIHADDRAGARQTSGVDRAADEVADDRRHRKEEADRDPGEAGQDKQDCFRSDIGDAAADLGGSQASVPKQSEGGDCGGDPNGEAPVCLKLSTAFPTNARRRRSKLADSRLIRSAALRIAIARKWKLDQGTGAAGADPPREGCSLSGASLSCVFVSKSLASWRSCNWL